jgi:hypothetical protein
VLDALSPTRRRLVLLVASGLALGVVLVASLVGVRLARDRVQPVSQEDQGPVLLVSGYGGSTRSLEPLRRALRSAGRDVVVVPPVRGGTGDLRTQAAALGRRARAAARRFSSPSVDVVGYSAGGVVARTWVRDFGGASLARRVLSLGSPQHGTELAELAVGIGGRCPPACRQLEPDSSLLRRLNARDETPRGPRFVSVWSTADRVVVPTGSARLAGALDFTVQSVCPAARTQHGDLPSDPVVLAALGTTLGAGPPHPPTGVRC